MRLPSSLQQQRYGQSDPDSAPARGGAEPVTWDDATFAQVLPCFQKILGLSFPQVRALLPPLAMVQHSSAAPVCPSLPWVFANREAQGYAIATKQHGEAGPRTRHPSGGGSRGIRDDLRTQKRADSTQATDVACGPHRASPRTLGVRSLRGRCLTRPQGRVLESS